MLPLITMETVYVPDRRHQNLGAAGELELHARPQIPFLQRAPDGSSQQPNVDLRLENVTANQALYALLNNYNLGIVDDPETRIARITVKDPAAPDPLVNKVIQLKYSSTSNMVESVRTVLVDKRSKVVPDNRTSQLVLLATAKEIAAADELVARLDLKTPEVLIEAKLVETQKNPTPRRALTGPARCSIRTSASGTTSPAGPGNRRRPSAKLRSRAFLAQMSCPSASLTP